MSRKTRKLIWSAPLVAVFAVVGALALFVALAPNQAQADHVDLPGIVTGVMAEADGRDTIDVEWTAPADGGAVDHYRIDRSEDGDNWMRLVQMHTDGTSYTDMMGLKPNRTYHYRVFGVNAAGTGPSSDLTVNSFATTADAGKPGPVEMLTATVDGPNQINLSWYPPQSNGGASITRYCISTTPAVVPDTPTTSLSPPAPAATTCSSTMAPTPNASKAFNADANDATGFGVIVMLAPMSDGKVEFMHKDLIAGKSRKYEVYAVNRKGWSDTATAVAPVPQTDAAGKPGAPMLRVVLGFPDDDAGTADVDESTIPNGNANIYWTWPDNGGAPITSWQLQRDEDNSWTSADHVGGADNDDLVARTAIGDAEHAISDASLLPTAPADDTTETKTTRFRVRALNATSNGAWSNVVSVTLTTIDVGGTDTVQPLSPPDDVSGLEASTNEHLRQIDLSWTDQSATSYLIDYSMPVTDAADREWKALQTNTGWTRSTYNHSSGLNPGTRMDYRVISLKNGLYGPIDTDDTGRTKDAEKPPAIRGLKTSSDDPTMIKLEWAKPASDGGQPITGYRVEISAYNGFEDDVATTRTSVTHNSDPCDPPAGTNDPNDGFCAREVMGADTTSYVLTKLSAGTDRWFRVFAINKVSRDDGESTTIAENFPDTDDIRTALPIKGTSAKSGTPGIPLDLTVQPARDANEDDPTKLGIDILWNAPDDPAGDEVTGYVIARRTKDSADAAWSAWDDDWSSISNEGSDFLRTYDTDTDHPDNLANGEMREYKVTAKSGAGSGPTTAAVVYPADLSHNHDPMANDMAIDRVTVDAGMMSDAMDVSMYFSDADGDTLTYRAMSDNTAIATASVSGSMVTITGVAEGMTTIKVYASDGMGGMEAMRTIDVTVESGNSDPMPGDQLPAAVSLMVGGDDEVITLTGSFTDADGDTLDYTAAVMPDDGSIATAMVTVDDTDPGAPVSMLTIAAVSAGMATVTVTADDGNGGTATHEIAVTVEAAPVPLMAPTITGTNPVGSGIVLVSWDRVANATGYSLIATNLTNPDAPTHTAPAGADASSGQIQGLTVGDEYLVFVGAFNDDLEFELSDYVRVTVE